MIFIVAPCTSRKASDLVSAAFSRSVTRSQVMQVGSGRLMQRLQRDIIVAINPDQEISDHLVQMTKSNDRMKIVLFGALTDRLMKIIGARSREWPEQLSRTAFSDKAQPRLQAESTARIRYAESASRLGATSWNRPLERFDFGDEWNNMGYGAIRVDSSDWAVSSPVEIDSDCLLATVMSDEFDGIAYSAIKDLDYQSILWFNRANGPIDSFEWRIIENFISNWRSKDLPCVPVVKEIPYGFDSCITMRLDCDEDIESARELRSEYIRLDIPFSLAIHSKLLANTTQHALIKEMVDRGESILSHSATHSSNWGGSYQAAISEARISAQTIRDVTGVYPKYAVSPFHQTPSFALRALSDSGYLGCIGGSISCNPEFNLARGGELAGLPAMFVGHSQQHMLHGDCMLQGSDPLAISKQAFMLAKATSTLFGYLDHPFSERYTYGWSDEATRIDAHRNLVLFIKASTKKPLFLSEDKALDFLVYKSKIRIADLDQNYRFNLQDNFNSTGYDVAIEYQGDTFKAIDGLILAKLNTDSYASDPRRLT